MNKQDKLIIQKFISFLREAGILLPQNSEIRWPDECERNKAALDCEIGYLAIEHTTLDSTMNQRMHDAWFHETFGAIEGFGSPSWNFQLQVSISYSATSKLQTINRSEVLQNFRTWLDKTALSLPNGWTHDIKISGIPFAFQVFKRIDKKTGVKLSRSLEGHEKILPNLHSLIERKAEKLRIAASPDKKKLPLLESKDFTMMNYLIIEEVLTEFYADRCPSGVDSLWLAHDSINGYFRESRGSLLIQDAVCKRIEDRL